MTAREILVVLLFVGRFHTDVSFKSRNGIWEYGTAFYFLKLYYPEFVENAWEKMIGSYGVSQVVYNYAISLFEKKKDKGEKAEKVK